MKNFIFWLMGDALGGLIVNRWHWLWQTPTASSPPVVKTSNQLTLEHAEQLLASIAQRVAEMEKAVAQVRQITREIKHQYEAKYQQHQELLELVAGYQKAGEIVEARLTMAKAIGIERILPELQNSLEHSQEMLISISDYHTQEQSKLALLGMEMSKIKACMLMNDSMQGSQDLDQTSDLNNLQEKFKNVQNEIEDRYRQIQVMSQLSYQTHGAVDEPLNMQDIDARLKSMT